MKLRVNELREKKGMTFEKLAEAAGYSVPFVQRLAAGKRRPNADNLRRLAEALGCNEKDLIQDAGPAKRMELVEIEVIGAVQAGAWVPSMEWDVGDRYPILVSPWLAEHEAFGLEVRGPSMNLKYPEGSIVICVPLLNFWRELRSEDDVVCQRRDHDLVEATVKELRLDATGRAWLWPRSSDPEHQTPIRVPWPVDDTTTLLNQQEIEIKAVVVGDYRIRIRP